ncbi:MAG: hypothetical protein M1142_05605 [Patescibacteria group bacterium]|nr:hypothetical protein [Patescibacteria group bacterium]
MAVATEQVLKRGLGIEGQLCLSPINPFLPVHRQILECWLVKGLSYQEGIKELNLTQDIIEDRIYGDGSCNISNTDRSSFWLRRRSLGIFGIIEVLTGKRPQNRDEALEALVGDIILENYDPEASEFYQKIHHPSRFGKQYFKQFPEIV